MSVSYLVTEILLSSLVSGASDNLLMSLRIQYICQPTVPRPQDILLPQTSFLLGQSVTFSEKINYRPDLT